jgi:hypothetical protein
VTVTVGWALLILSAGLLATFLSAEMSTEPHGLVHADKIETR